MESRMQELDNMELDNMELDNRELDNRELHNQMEEWDNKLQEMNSKARKTVRRVGRAVPEADHLRSLQPNNLQGITVLPDAG